MTDAYELLKAYGHTPAKAAEIILDAQRGDLFCRGWIKVVEQHFSPDRNPKGGDAKQGSVEDEGRFPAPNDSLQPPSSTLDMD